MKSHDEKVKDYSRIASIRESISGEERIKGVRKRSSAGMKEKERERTDRRKRREERERENRKIDRFPVLLVHRARAQVCVREYAHSGRISATRP